MTTLWRCNTASEPWVAHGSPRYGRRVQTFERISVDPRVMGGVPCVRGTRIPVATIMGMLAGGMTPAAILQEFSQLSADDLEQAQRFAAAPDGGSTGMPATA
jgi:uncharacterized protein (DUF433 family)